MNEEIQKEANAISRDILLSLRNISLATLGLSFASSNLAAALTDETGSGLAVFNISPDLVAPVSITGISTSDLPTYGSETLPSSGGTWTSVNWTGDNITGWHHTIGNTSVLSESTAATISQKYQITYTITGRTAGSVTIAYGGESSAGIIATGAWGPSTTSVAGLSVTPTTDFDGTIILSVKKVISPSDSLFKLKTSNGSLNSEIRATSAYANLFIGFSSGFYVTTGAYNIGIGYNALAVLSTASYNVAIGYGALASNTVGFQNFALGSSALQNNITGSYNVAIGYAALYANLNSYNVAIGRAALDGNTTGAQNIAIGYISGRSITTGTTNTFIGSQSGNNASQKVDAVNSMALGFLSYTTASNQVVIGNTSVTQTLLRGSVGIGMTPTYTLDITGNFRTSTGFGCNSKTPQTAYASGGALAAYVTGAFGLDSNAHMTDLYNLVVAIRAALVANGIMS